MAGDSIPLWRILWRYNADGFRVTRMNKCRVAGRLQGAAEPSETQEQVRARMMEAVVSFVRESRSLTLTIEQDAEPMPRSQLTGPGATASNA
jgi:hypothetical protein